MPARQKVFDLFGDAMDRPPAERPQFLDEACAGDQELRNEVASLLAADEQAGEFLDTPVVPQELALGRLLDVTSSASPEQLLEAAVPAPAAAYRARSPFFWVAVLLGSLLLIFYSHGAKMVYRYGYTSKVFGWTSSRTQRCWQITGVDKSSPVYGKLRNGDCLVAFNDDPRIARIGPEVYRMAIRPETAYSLRISRGAEQETYDLLLGPLQPVGPFLANIIYLVLSIAFFAMALMIGLLKPDEALPRIAFIAGLLAAARLLVVWLTVYRGVGNRTDEALTQLLLIEGILHFSVTYHFFYKFFFKTRRKGWHGLIVVLYVVSGTWSIARAAFVFSLFRTPPEVISFLRAHAWIVDLNELLVHSPWRQALEFSAVLAICAIVAYGQRLMTDQNSKRRVRWLIGGCLLGFTPYALFQCITLAFKMSGNPSFLQNDGWGRLEMLVNAFLLFIPATLTYVVMKHRVLGITVVIRFWLQYLLARNVLRVLLLLPFLGILWPVLNDPDRSLTAAFRHNSAYWNVVLVVAIGLSLRYRKRLHFWLDRKFFRDAGQHDSTLHDLISDLKHLEDIPTVSKMVAASIEAALHPRSVHVLIRNAHGTLTLRHSIVSDSDCRDLDTVVQKAFAHTTTVHDVDILRQRMQGSSSWLLVPVCGSKSNLIGLLVLGEKKSETPWSDSDMRLLRGGADQIAVLLERVWLKKQVDEDQRVRRIGLGHYDDRAANLLWECPECDACFDATHRRCSSDGAELVHRLAVERITAGRYRLDRRIGSGGMGVVYQATDLLLQRQVAVKLLLDKMVGNREAIKRFEREARVTAGLNHPHIVSLYDFGRINTEAAYLVMELVSGSTMRYELRRCGVIAPLIAADWFDQLLSGLEFAHSAGIVHRDLKPENVLIVSQGQNGRGVKLVDFGVAKLRSLSGAPTTCITEAGLVLGTLGYMSPEQLNGMEPDERSDVYSVGVMVAEVLTGKLLPPRDAGDVVGQFCAAFGTGGAQLGNVIASCLAFDRSDRFQTAASLRAVLKEALLACSAGL